MHKINYFFILFLFICSISVKAQNGESPYKKRTPYQLMSTYYNEDFNPFKKGNTYFGISLSLEDRKMENTDNLFQKVIDGNRINYNIQFKSG